MSEGNEADGQKCYADGDSETCAWFEQQWAHWPHRVHQERTTNISFLYGGIKAYRAEHDENPDMSSDFRSHVERLDRYARKGE